MTSATAAAPTVGEVVAPEAPVRRVWCVVDCAPQTMAGALAFGGAGALAFGGVEALALGGVEAYELAAGPRATLKVEAVVSDLDTDPWTGHAPGPHHSPDREAQP